MPGTEIEVVRYVFPRHLKSSRPVFIALWLDV